MRHARLSRVPANRPSKGAGEAQGEIAGRRTKTGYEAEFVHKQSLRTVCDWRRIGASGTGAACKADAFGTSGHVTAKSSIYSVGGDTDKGAF